MFTYLNSIYANICMNMLNSRGIKFANICENKVLANISEFTVPLQDYFIQYWAESITQSSWGLLTSQHF